MEDIQKYFGPIHNQNGHNYVFSENPKIIAKVESLWMIIHQKMCVPASRIISLGMAKGACYVLGHKIIIYQFQQKLL
jgi:hypothetical protein